MAALTTPARCIALGVALLLISGAGGRVWAGPHVRGSQPHPIHCEAKCCAPQATTYGHHETAWRSWPNEFRPDQTLPQAIGSEVLPTPKGVEEVPLPAEPLSTPRLPGGDIQPLPPVEGGGSGNILPPGRIQIEEGSPLGPNPTVPLPLEEPPSSTIPGLPAETPAETPPTGTLPGLPTEIPPTDTLPEMPAEKPPTDTVPGVPLESPPTDRLPGLPLGPTTPLPPEGSGAGLVPPVAPPVQETIPIPVEPWVEPKPWRAEPAAFEPTEPSREPVTPSVPHAEPNLNVPAVPEMPAAQAPVNPTESPLGRAFRKPAPPVAAEPVAPLVQQEPVDRGAGQPVSPADAALGRAFGKQSFELPTEAAVPTDHQRPTMPINEQPVSPVAPVAEQPVDRGGQGPVAPTHQEPVDSAAPVAEQAVDRGIDRPAPVVPTYQQPAVAVAERPVDRGTPSPVAAPTYEQPAVTMAEQPVDRGIERPVVPTYQQPTAPVVEQQPVEGSFQMPVAQSPEDAAAPTTEESADRRFDRPLGTPFGPSPGSVAGGRSRLGTPFGPSGGPVEARYEQPYGAPAERPVEAQFQQPMVPPGTTVRMAVAEEPPPAIEGPVGLDGYCPVELAERENWVSGEARWAARHAGVTYLMSSFDRQQRFLANASRYVPVFGGFDPVRITDDQTRVEGKTEFCAVYDGRLFMFSNAASLARFHQDPRRYSAAAAAAAR